jgi:hypothetical protein
MHWNVTVVDSRQKMIVCGEPRNEYFLVETTSEFRRLLLIFWRRHEFDDDFPACLNVRSTTNVTHATQVANELQILVSFYVWYL